MTTIKYTITFFSEWHTGSGLTSGSDLNSLVIKDKNKLPVIPGRTLKGLFREAAEDLAELKNCDQALDDQILVNQIFGIGDDKNKDQADLDESDEKSLASESDCFFTNATIPVELSDAVLDEQLTPHFYRSFASTAIEKNGIAKSHSLRTMETTIPCTLEAEIYNVPEDGKTLIGNCAKWIKRLGQNRNRGLGRCQFEIIKKEG